MVRYHCFSRFDIRKHKSIMGSRVNGNIKHKFHINNTFSELKKMPVLTSLSAWSLPNKDIEAAKFYGTRQAFNEIVLHI